MKQKNNRKSIPFRAQARTIDHLGKGQIADAPTAVSELWKNSYDAYARDVALHLFDGDIKCGAIIDNGCGMNFRQLTNSWLAIGTMSKANKELLPDDDRFGLAKRVTQGEKGIGRLSTSFLAPVTLLITKKRDTDFSLALIDWRFFENTHLSLNEIRIPVASCTDLSEVSEIFKELTEDLLNNLALNPAAEDFEAKSIRIAWERFSEDELKKAVLDGDEEYFSSTQDQIVEFSKNFKFDNEMLSTWQRMLNKYSDEDKGEHGTGMFLLDLNRDLSLLTNRHSLSSDDPELNDTKKDLVDTLRAFINPFQSKNINFSYEIGFFDKNIDRKNYDPAIILNDKKVFSNEDFLKLEHRVDGIIDEKGWFRGDITAFGNTFRDVKLNSMVRLSRSELSLAGPFEIKIGTFETERKKSSLSDKEYADCKALWDADYNGLMIYRDGLRVLPYGRADYDFFQLEERRGKNAGRYFWSHRRIFGQILLTQEENYRLKDKAGREGFIKNQAAREFKLVVIDQLIKLADEFFGSNAEVRKDLLEILSKEKEVKKKAQIQSSANNLAEFRHRLKENTPIVSHQLYLVRDVYKILDERKNLVDSEVTVFDRIISDAEAARVGLRTPSKPAGLSEALENDYREYRDYYAEFSELLHICRAHINKAKSESFNVSPQKIATQKFNSHQSKLIAQIKKYERLFENKIENFQFKWRSEASSDKKLFYSEGISILDSVSNDESLEIALNVLDSIYINLTDNFTIKYESIIRALDKLEQGIDLDAAFSMSEEEKVYFEDKANKLQALAQLGISVEVLAHELEQQDMLVTRGLNSLSRDAKSQPGFTTAYEAHKQLTSHIRFLSPLKLSGYQARKKIFGYDILKHIQAFFRDRFERQRVELGVDEKFLKMEITDLPSRIYPVFVNLFNNALHWVSLSETRMISINIVDDLVVVSNNGPSVDSDDIPRLFEIFYSRRPKGNGVGLYLCRENLAVANHKIWYAESEDQKVIPDGANFVIKFNGVEFK
ncbi:ATP-binding protein [Vibrio splendidus]